MTYITKRSDSSLHQFRVRVPQELLPVLKGRRHTFSFPPANDEDPVHLEAQIGNDVKFSLRTRDAGVAKQRDALARAELAKLYVWARKEVTPLTHMQIVALSGIVYRMLVELHHQEPGEASRWAAFKAFSRAAAEGRIRNAPQLDHLNPHEEDRASEAFGDDLTVGIDAHPPGEPGTALEERFGGLADYVLVQQSIKIDTQTRARLLREIARASIDAGWRLKRAAEGDYSEDPKAGRFPPVQASKGVTLTELFGKWRAEADRSPSTISSWQGVLKHLKAHLGHEDVRRIRPEDVVGWKDALVAVGRSAKTINDGHLAALRTLLSYGVTNRLLTSNAAAGIKVANNKQVVRGSLEYRDEQVAALLAAADAESRPDRHWLPWLAALSGARIGELAMLWSSQITVVDGTATMHITVTDDGGRLKNAGSDRLIPIHPAILKRGFLKFVESKSGGPLFYKRSSGKSDKKHASKGVTNRIAAWISALGIAEGKQRPNHALRHWWKSQARKVRMPNDVRDYLQGHSPATEGDRYGSFPMEALSREVALIPVPQLRAKTAAG